MDVLAELEQCHTYPIVYKVEIEKSSFDDTLQLLVEEILQESPCYKCEVAIVNYVTRVIDPVGWNAVWRATQHSLGIDIECDFVVEVVEVSPVKLEAEVVVKSVIVPKSSDLDFSALRGIFRAGKSHMVPLIELYPISEGDEEELLVKTAVAIEHIRIFYNYLCRPWELEEVDDVVYTEKLLKPRLQLYFDMKFKVLPEMMIAKINNILKEAWTAVNNLKTLYSEMNVSDSESELNEDDVLKTVECRKKLEELRMKMDVLENPAIRSIIMKKYTPTKSSQKQSNEQGPFMRIVAHQFTFEMIANLKLDPQTLLKFDNCPERALKSCLDGDTVLIFPGHYRIDMLGWFDGSITVKGIGPSGSIKLDATGNSEVFLNCDAPSVVLENLVLVATSKLVSTVVIHHGHVVMKECVIDNDGAETGITLLGGATLTMNESEVCNAREDGIQMRMASSLSMTSCKIISCGQHGISIDVDDEAALPFSNVELNLSNCHILSNDGYALYISSPVLSAIQVPVKISSLNSFPWLKHKVDDDVVMNLNKFGEIGTGAACKVVTNIPLLPLLE